MSRGINKVILIGNLGADPEVRETQSGTAVANLRLATNERRKKGDDYEDVVEWHRVVCFGKLAEVCRDYLAKGRQIYIEGSLRTNKWEDKDGNDRYTTEVVAYQMQMLGARDEQGESTGSYNSDGPKVDDDDIPF